MPVENLRRALRAWGLGDADIIEIKPGVTADVFLVMRGRDRWVAKYNYHYRDYFEVGLRASSIVDARTGTPTFRVAVPVETENGALTEMVEWPPGSEHPLALLTYVPGDPASGDDPEGPTLLGTVCGRVHAALLDVAPADVGIATLPAEPDGNYPDRDAGDYAWLHGLWRELEAAAWEQRDAVRHAVAVWDGPDIRRWAGGLSLLDFGHCGWHPIVHVVANRSLNAALRDESRLEPFLLALGQHLTLTPAEEELFQLHRVRNAAIYARWVAMEKVARNERAFNDEWFRALLDLLEREGPRIGVAPSRS